jgi:hypothetical protein
MNAIATALATAGLLAGITIANAQAPSPSQPQSQQTIDSNKGDQLNPSGTPGGTRVNPSPSGSTGMGGTTGAAPGADTPAPGTQAPPSPSRQPLPGQGNPDDASRLNAPNR